MLRRTISLGATGALALGAVAVPTAQGAGASGQAASAACSLRLGSVTANGAHTSRVITAGSPSSVSAADQVPGIFGAGQVKLTSTFVARSLGAPREGRSGLTVLGSGLYATTYATDSPTRVNPSYPVRHRKVGAGWGTFRRMEQSTYRPSDQGEPARTTLYGQEANGGFHRWVADGTTWRKTGGGGGLTTVKGMTLIGRSATHDTFIANSRAGKLLTITWPTSRFVHWTGATVRDTTWQNFEHLIATSCGSSGTLLLGIDTDTRTGYLYAVGHANGRNTVVKGLGKVPMTFSDPHYFRWAPYYDVLNGG